MHSESEIIADLLSTPPVVIDSESLAKIRADASESLLRDMRRQDNAARWLSACPPELQESDWGHPLIEPYAPQIAAVLAWSGGKKGIVASGPTGRGKSRSMWQLMHKLGVEQGLDVRYWSASDWFTTLQQQIRYGRDEARGWVEAVASRHIVFIDDLGQESVRANDSDWANGWLFRFMDIRVGLGLPLFLTTNLSAAQIAGAQSGVRANPLIRRILDLCEPVKF